MHNKFDQVNSLNKNKTEKLWSSSFYNEKNCQKNECAPSKDPQASYRLKVKTGQL